MGDIMIIVMKGGSPRQGAVVQVESIQTTPPFNDSSVTQLPDGAAHFSPPDGEYRVTATYDVNTDWRDIDTTTLTGPVTFEF